MLDHHMSMQLLLIRVYVEFKKPNTLKSVSAVYSCIQKRGEEAYMGRLCDEYIELLSGDGDPSEKFWQLDKRIR